MAVELPRIRQQEGSPAPPHQARSTQTGRDFTTRNTHGRFHPTGLQVTRLHDRGQGTMHAR